MGKKERKRGASEGRNQTPTLAKAKRRDNDLAGGERWGLSRFGKREKVATPKALYPPETENRDS